MTYYLGKVLSSCKDLYNDVNAAYLTGAIDIIVIRQKDGSLKSTPFHVRFGKLGVLRTGDLKEIELEINGEVVDLHMKVDESGRGFFSKKRHSESVSDSDSERRAQIALDMESPLPPSSHDDHVTHLERDTTILHPELPKQNSDGVLLLGQTKLSEYDFETRRLSTPLIRESSEALSDPVLGNGCEEQSTSFMPEKSTPILIKAGPMLRGSSDIIPRSCSLPMAEEVMSDSALDRQRCDSLRSETSISTLSALSDTEVEVKDRLTSKLWEWSATSRRKRGTSLGEASSSSSTGLLEDEYTERSLPQPASVDRRGFWSALAGILKRRNTQRKASMENGMYLDDFDYDSMDPDELSKFFPSSSVSTDAITTDTVGVVTDQTGSSGLGSSPALSPSQSADDDMMREDNSRLLSLLKNSCAFSLCGGLAQGNITDEQFQGAQVPYSDFCADPAAIFTNPSLVVLVDGKYYNWQTASALLLSSIAFLQVLPEPAQDKLTKKLMPKKVIKPQKSSWLFWGRWSKDIEDNEDLESKAKSEGCTPIGSPRKWDHVERSKSLAIESGKIDILSSDDEQEQPVRPRQRSLKKKKTGFTTTPSSEQLASLPLKPGANTVTFSVTTKYQGTTKAQCTLYLWNYFDKIVVSDIDGTITRSDVAGQVLPFLGKDWTQNGVVELYGCISHNGYHIMYLSARAIGQAGYTKEFLRNIKRGSCSLPDGPLFLAPFSLYIAFRKEVIEKKPEEFKIECLKQIRNLFPDDFNPFHAGFGNKPSDAMSYVQVEIPPSRIFTVNHKGLIKHKLSVSFQSNYTDLKRLADVQFSPLKYTEAAAQDETDSATPVASVVDIEACNIKEDFNTFNYWRENNVLDQYLADLPELT
ncbi:phosphatidate phosphatase LPIN2-like [Halichondria panicea]|uniref:phosphatidate phosphatase LPIN2-like n=1 Tax=Halichondria panicea TaxID=6063 RepID=UPI00312B50D4